MSWVKMLATIKYWNEHCAVVKIKTSQLLQDHSVQPRKLIKVGYMSFIHVAFAHFKNGLGLTTLYETNDFPSPSSCLSD